MDAEYLQRSVGPLLSKALALAVLRNPKDKVEFIAKYMLETVAVRKKERDVEDAKRKKEDEQRAREEKLEAAEKVAAEAQSSQSAADAEREKQFNNVLENASSVDEVLPAFLQFLRGMVGASAAYIGRLESGAARGDDEAGPDSLRYIAATPENEWILEKKLDANKGKVTFKLFEPEEEPEELPEEDEDGNPIARAPVDPPLRSVFVPDVLLGPLARQLHFWRLPRPGCYYALRIQLKNSVGEETLDECVEREGELLQQKKEEDEARAQAEKEAEEERRREAGEDVEEEEKEEGEDDEEEDEEDEDDGNASARRSRRNKKKSGAEENEDEEEESDEETEEEREEREEKERAERERAEEEFIIQHINRPLISYALCLDTLGGVGGSASGVAGVPRRFSDEQMESIQKAAKKLQQKLVELDRAAFTIQRQKRKQLLEFQRDVLASLSGGGNEEDGSGAGGEPVGLAQGVLRSEEEKAEEMDRISDELEQAGKHNTDEDVAYAYRTELILTNFKPFLSEYGEHMSGIRGPMEILQAVFYLLGYPKSAVIDAQGQPEWSRMRQLFSGEGEEFFGKLRDYDPRATSFDSVSKEDRYTQSPAVSKLIESLNVEEVRERNYILSELLLWVRDVLAVKKRAKIEKALAERAEAKRRAAEEKAKREEEERKKREEEEEQRRANGEVAEGEENEEGGEEEEEEDEE